MEPTAGLDPAARQGIWRKLISVAAKGATVVLSTHRSQRSATLPTYSVVERWRIRAHGPPHEVIAQADALALIVSGQGRTEPPGAAAEPDSCWLRIRWARIYGCWCPLMRAEKSKRSLHRTVAGASQPV